MRLAFFVTPHGFGHAARAAAVMQALAQQRPQLGFEIFSSVPRWFFSSSLEAPFRYHELDCDVGLVQRSSLAEDPVATVRALSRLLPPPPALVQELAQQLTKVDCAAVVADVAPLGLLVAAAAARPAVLVENFTWDWIYGAYLESAPALEAYAARIAEINAGAALRVQTEPWCRRHEGTPVVAPISRRPRHARARIRERLGVPPDRPLVLLTMGGIPHDFGPHWSRAAALDAHFVIPGTGETECRQGNVVRLPHHSSFYHPDLVRAADLVVGKLGYSTVAEVACASAALAYVPRPRFPESPILARWVCEKLGAREIAADELASFSWLERLDELLESRSAAAAVAIDDGADECARLILETVDRGR